MSALILGRMAAALFVSVTRALGLPMQRISSQRVASVLPSRLRAS